MTAGDVEPAQANVSPFIGRSGELAALIESLKVAEAGRFQFAVVEGEPGIGKTTLLNEVSNRAERHCFVVARGAAAELERGAAFGPLMHALAEAPVVPPSVRSSIRRLVLGPQQQVEDPGQVRFRVLERFVEAIEAIVLERPLLLCLDDLQWADDGTLALLARLPRRFAYAPLAVVVARRRLPRSPQIDALVARLPPAERHEVQLAPLGEDDLVRIATGELVAEPGPRLRRQLLRTGGNPLLVTELLIGLAREGAVGLHHGRAEIAEGAAPQSLAAAVRRRVKLLPADAAALIDVAAVLGPSFTAAELTGALGLDAPRAAAALRFALEEGLLIEASDTIAFRHQLLRDVIYGDLSQAVRRTLHVAAAEALEASGATAARVAAHLEAASDLGDTRAARWLRRAAGESLSPTVAVDYLRRALALPAPPRERDELLADLAQALLWAGDPQEAERTARELLLRGPVPVLRAGVLGVLFRSLLVQGKTTGVLEILGAHSGRLPERDRGLLLAEASYLLAEGRHDAVAEQAALAGDRLTSDEGPPEAAGRAGARELAEEALVIGERLDDADVVCLSLCTLSSLLDRHGHFGEAIDLSRRAVAVADGAAGHLAQRHGPHFHLALQLLLADRVGESKAVALQGIARCEAAGVVWALPLLQYLLGRAHFATGAWDEAMADWEAARTLGEEVGTRMIVGDAAHAFLAQIALHRGDLKRAEAHVAAAAAEAAAQNPDGGAAPFALWAQALVLEARGRAEEAAATAALVHAVAQNMDWLALYRLVGIDLTRIAAAAGQHAAAREVASAVELLAARSRSPSTVAAASLARGLADGDLDGLSTAAEDYAGSELVFERAAAQEAAAAALLNADADRAAALLHEALRVYEDLRAKRLVARVEGLLASIGRAPRRRGRPRGEAIGWQSLTDAERRVAGLVADGMSNARIAETLVISPRTVQTHVGHIFMKLGMTNRAQLAAEAVLRASVN